MDDQNLLDIRIIAKPKWKIVHTIVGAANNLKKNLTIIYYSEVRVASVFEFERGELIG